MHPEYLPDSIANLPASPAEDEEPPHVNSSPSARRPSTAGLAGSSGCAGTQAELEYPEEWRQGVVLKDQNLKGKRARLFEAIHIISIMFEYDI